MVQPGDWVRFYRSGTLVIGVVQYVRCRSLGPDSNEVCTDIGTIPDTCILEVRSPERIGEGT